MGTVVDLISSLASLVNAKSQKGKAPQVGLEPTPLRLTEGFHVVAGSCGLLLYIQRFAFPDHVALLT
jgi:hypothetical protein